MEKQIPIFDSNGNLPKGCYKPSIKEFEEKFVHDFTTSKTRQEIFTGYKEYCEKMAAFNIATKQWVDGSFITNRENPNDIDLLTHIDALKLNASKSIQYKFREIKDNENCKRQYKCDAQLIFVYPEIIPSKYDFYQEVLEYWKNFFGKDRDGNAKGVIEFDSLEDILTC